MKALLSVLTFAISLLGTAALMSRVLPPLEVPVVDEKLAFFADHRDAIDTLFFGSSRTYAQIFPAMFDEKTAEAGIPTHSFNFGIDGMFPPEDGYVAEKLFALRPKNLHRVFIELSFFRNHWFGMDQESVRALHWHDGPRLRLLWMESIGTYQFIKERSGGKSIRWRDWRKNFNRWWTDLSFGKPLQLRIANMAVNSQLYFRRTFNAGRGSDFVARLGKGTVRDLDWSLLGEDRRGMRQPMSRKALPEPPLDKFDRVFSEVSAKPVPLRPMEHGEREDVRRIVALVRAAGAEPILFIAPDVMPCRRYLPEEPDLPLFDFSEVARWPQLFRRENRLDASHLDYDGAKTFTEEFARMFIAHEQGKIRR